MSNPKYDFGLVANIPLDKNGMADKGAILDRYARLSRALFPTTEVASPEIEETTDFGIREMNLKGKNLEVAVLMRTGRVWAVSDSIRSQRDVIWGQVVSSSKLEGTELAQLDTEIREALKLHIGLTIPTEAECLTCLKEVYRDLVSYHGYWFMNYYGYGHNNHSIHVTAVREQDGLHFVEVLNAVDEAPPVPKIAVGEAIARMEGSRAALAFWSAKYGSAHEVGTAVVTKIVYTYRTSYLQATADWPKVMQDNDRAESCLAYAVEVQGMATTKAGEEHPERMTVYISCEDGKPVDCTELTPQGVATEE